jgi:hypothetical protein
VLIGDPQAMGQLEGHVSQVQERSWCQAGGDGWDDGRATYLEQQVRVGAQADGLLPSLPLVISPQEKVLPSDPAASL